jgi:uncharacterized repeat protein (TIGR03803 family)
MRSKRLSIGLRVTLAIFIITLFATSTYAATEKVLFSYNGKDGDSPWAGLIFDKAGNLYGTTIFGGANGYGTVFELTPKAGGGWTEKILHSFNDSGKDGYYPYAGLIFDDSGNLYGTTQDGGARTLGTVFELTPKAGGGWTEKVLYSFGSHRGDGYAPYASRLIFDTSGNLYGTTQDGGAYVYGTVFELTPKAGGGWTEKVLHSFGSSTDGTSPWAGLIFDKAGNLYGTTRGGGAYVYGTVFELTPKAGGGWTEKLLHSFGSSTDDGAFPEVGLIFDKAGNLYGTTYGGGAYTDGTVFELTPKAGGGWTEKVLHNFGSYRDGAAPTAGLIFDKAGNLYGTTSLGGARNEGTVFELTPKAGGGWTEKVLHSFNPNGRDGFGPFDDLILDASGNLYGTTYYGGVYGYGMVFEIKP